MNWLKQKKSSADDYLFDHPKTRRAIDWAWKGFITIVTCFIFAWGFRAFVNPTTNCVIHWTMQSTGKSLEEATKSVEETGVIHLIAGGMSGVSQAIVKLMNIFGDFRATEKTIISIMYFVLNIPLLILGWFKISKQFTVFTLINVGFVSLFNEIIPDEWIYNVINIYDDMIARCIFGGIITGIASGAAMMINTSSGGTDVLSFYIAEKKSAAPGSFSFYINACILLTNILFGVIGHAVNPTVNPQLSSELIRYALYTIIYLFVATKVIDFLNVKNKKEELQIFTSNDNLSQILIHAFPHSATSVEAKGAYTGNRRILIYMVVSKREIKKATELVQKADPSAFVTVININQVYGRFYIRPIE
jgi:uncharacterized membrane-anchored protein YitT (DUF2179 family)